MKKKLLSALLCLALALTLLPTAALAAPTRLKSVDLVIDLPKAGDPNEMETEVTIKSMKSGNIDLLANGAGILYTEWEGDDVETDDGYAFRAGTTYLVNIKLAFDTTKGYCANYKTVGGENIVGPDTFSATVNGVPATIRTSAQYFPTLQVSLTLEGERYTEQEKEELNADLTRKTDLLRQAKRAMATPRTQAVAESKQLENFVNGVTVMTDANHVLENTDSIRTLILDTNGKITDGTCFFICYAKYLKELWLSDKVDVYQFIQAMDSYLWLPIAGLYRWERQSDLPFYTEGRRWQRQSHIYVNPFYYIDYCLAQTVSLEFWAMIQKDKDDAWQHYMAYTRQGGSRTFTELLQNAGLESPFDESCLRGVCAAAEQWLDSFDMTGIL